MVCFEEDLGQWYETEETTLQRKVITTWLREIRRSNDRTLQCHDSRSVAAGHLFLLGVESYLGQGSRLLQVQWPKVCWGQGWR